VTHQQFSSIIIVPVSEPKHFGESHRALVTFELDLGEHLKFFLECLTFGIEIKLLQNSILFMSQ